MKASIILGWLLFAILVATAPLQAAVEEGAARTTPWSGYWWQLKKGELLGPLGKYDQLTGSHAGDWERQHKQPAAREEGWAGYCHAWSASAVLEKEPTAPVKRGQTVLGVGDQKGLLVASHASDVANFYGKRYYGRPEDDYQDIYPDALWHYLKLYVKQQGVPLIMDLEAGVEVWNYPVYAYRIEYAPQGDSGLQLAHLSLWAADDAVPPDYVGVKVHYTTYQFTFRLENGSVVAGSGRWTGESVKTHPDFAWYPYVVRSENPEVVYAKVKELVGGGDPSIPGPTTPQPGNPTPGSLQPEPVLPSTVTSPPNVLPGIPPRLPPDFGGPQPAVNPAVPVSPVELVSMITHKTSSFGFHATVNKFDGGHYVVGEPFKVRGVSDQDGYLYLFHFDSQGGLELLCPPAEHNITVRAQLPFLMGPYTAAGAVGTHCVKALVTKQPLMLTGLVEADSSAGEKGIFRLRFRWCPSQEQQVQQMLVSYQGQQQGTTPGKPTQEPSVKSQALPQANPERLIGLFAQDDILFYVGPADTNK